VCERRECEKFVEEEKRRERTRRYLYVGGAARASA
jgi:hypothetical protein